MYYYNLIVSVLQYAYACMLNIVALLIFHSQYLCFIPVDRLCNLSLIIGSTLFPYALLENFSQSTFNLQTSLVKGVGP